MIRLFDHSFYHGLSSEIKDALVHFDNPLRYQLLWTWRFGSTNRLLKDARNKDYHIRGLSSSDALATPITSRFMNQQQQQRLFETKTNCNLKIDSTSFINLPSAGPLRNQATIWTSTLCAEDH
ncbi:hypothetical protein BASA81_017760 [Batrachochytrium salamandrivorans]|nr:hypothetical protein BASA81_017760 [Batrachochytrium salamandrivorans]